MDHCDAIVVGGGPAGSACARMLSQAGLDVHVLDKSSFPRDKTCAGWITPEVLPLTDLDPREYAAGRVFQTVRGFRISRIGGPEFETTYGEPVSFGICRCQFDHYLLERCGARLDLHEPVRTIERAGHAWRINDRIEAPLVVGAGGHFCPIAQHLGAKADGAGRVVVAQELEVALTPSQAETCRVDPEIPELYFCEDLRGYGWCFRKADVLNVGLGREDSTRLSEHVQQFLAFLYERDRIPLDIPARMRGHAYTLYGHAHRNRTGDGMILVGDAAGMAYSPSGEGIRTAIESAQLAAQTVVAASGNYSRCCLHRYETELIRRFGSSDAHDAWLAFIPAALKQAVARWLFAVPWFVRKVVLERWFLHAAPGRRTMRRFGRPARTN